ncbi:AI-2E family transporter [Belnapia sp. T6]|uniref:AI-2E family transporter n=1 Tax=Belnapia mucosa TaxID=2804532 RepID=A0ABS1VBP3_9PROT|nr:AI-2E family transporter [Belnapia mucosa]MBL6459092.1 AI-2E family transporter [Belnapia mucosa]
MLIVAAVAGLALLLWAIRSALLLAFAALVVAVLLLAVTKPLERWFGLRRIWSLAALGTVLVLALALVGVMVGGQLRSQVAQLGEHLPGAVQKFETRFGIDLPVPGERNNQDAAPGGRMGRTGQAPSSGQEGGLDGSLIRDVARRAAGISFGIFEALSALALAVIGGFFLAADPGLYRRGLVALLPKTQHARADEALCASGRALRVWLRAQLLCMLLVGVLVGLGTWAIGLPAPLAIGLFAGLAEFVPFIGSVLGIVPALLLALGQGWEVTLWTIGLYVAVQQLEANLVFPLLGQKMIHIPAMVLLFAIVAFSAVLGIGGTVLAAPLTVVAFVLVQKLYIRDVLGERMQVPGEPDAPSSGPGHRPGEG